MNVRAPQGSVLSVCSINWGSNRAEQVMGHIGDVVLVTLGSQSADLTLDDAKPLFLKYQAAGVPLVQQKTVQQLRLLQHRPLQSRQTLHDGQP